MSDRPATEPRTEAGRALVKWAPTVLPDWPWLLDKVLAIEAEAAQGAAPLTIEEYNVPSMPSEYSEGAAPRAERTDWPALARDLIDQSPESTERLRQRVEGAAPRAEGRYFLANDPAVEALAALEHEQWEEWSRTIAEQGLTPERIERWQAYWVPYADLTDDVQEHDRVWARKAIAALRDAGYTLSRPSDERVPPQEEATE